MSRLEEGPYPPGGPRSLAACLVVLLLFSACATTPKTPPPGRSPDTIVLLPDDRGKTGAIVVSGAGGERLLSETRQAVTVAPGAGPGKPFVLSKEEVRTLAGPALSALPPRPVKFIFYFEYNSTSLTRESLDRVREVVRTVGNRGPVETSVVGHTDTVGAPGYNYRLGLERARLVADLLVEAGLNPSIIEVSSHGKGNPLVATGDGVPEPRNRRVELTVR